MASLPLTSKMKGKYHVGPNAEINQLPWLVLSIHNSALILSTGLKMLWMLLLEMEQGKEDRKRNDNCGIETRYKFGMKYSLFQIKTIFF